jgi:presenilin-like A22 family membrane protease
MKTELWTNAKKGLIFFVTITATFSIAIFAIKNGMPIQLFVFCAAFYLFYNTGRYLLFNRTFGNVIACVLSICLSSLWIIFPSVILTDITAILLGCAALYQISEVKISFREATILAIAVILYDVVMVFVTHGMVELAISLKASATPLMIAFTPAVEKYIHLKMIGLGDIVLPGSMMVACFYAGKRYAKRSLFVGALIGYFIGLLATIAIMNIFQYPQPATLYLYPGVFFGFWIALACNRISLKSVLTGGK